MKAKRNFLIKQSLKKKIDTKWFKIVNVLIAIVLVALVNMDKIIGAFGGDFKEENKIIIVDNNDSFDLFKVYFETYGINIPNFENTVLEESDKTVDEIRSEIEEDKTSNILIEINTSDSEYLTANIYSFDIVDNITYQILSTILNSIKSEYALENSGIDPNELAAISAPMTIERLTLNPDIDENAQAKSEFGSMISMVFIIPFFMLIVLLVQMLGAEINDEKSSRSMEIIISNVSPQTHFIAKIFGAFLFVLIQAVLFILYVALGLLVRYLMGGGFGLAEGTGISETVTMVVDLLKNTGIWGIIAQALPLILVLLLISLLAFAILAGVLASMTTSIEDFQQLQTPLMIIIMAGYFIGFMASMFEGAAFIKICSYIPFLSSMIAPVIFLLGQTTLIDLTISILLSAGMCFLLFYFGLRVYKVGILNYSSKDLWKKVFKSIKNQE